MTDPLDRLTQELDAATPRPDADTRATHLAQAQEIFDRAQESRDPARLSHDRPARAGLTERVRAMFASIGTRGALGATTAIVAVGLVMTVPDLRNALLPPGPLSVSETRVLPETEVLPATGADGADSADSADSGGDDSTGLLAARPVVKATDTAEADLRQRDPNRAAATTSIIAEQAPAAAPDAVVGGVADGFAMSAPAPLPLILEAEPYLAPPPRDTEAFANADTNPLRIVAEQPVSTFSVDVDTASWSVLRSSITAGALPPPDAVRIEEMINYFPYDYAAPDGDGAPFRASVSVAETPWNPGTQLLRIGLQGQLPAVADRPPLNLVFLVDTSGSMQGRDRLPLLIQSLRLMLPQLTEADEVAIVTYAGSAGVALQPVAGTDRRAIDAAFSRLSAGGSTAGAAGIETAYALAADMTADGEVSRVILATDGDFNVGISDPEALEELIADKRDSGTYLSVLGFGRGNLDDATMQALAQNGNGQAAYIDTLSEAQKVLVDQLTGALFPIADDVKIQIEFNPAAVAEYRLIGYETRALRREDFSNDKVDAGEIGAGHQVTALYEITPVGSDGVRNAPLRYGDQQVVAGDAAELAFLRLRWKQPGAAASQLQETPIANRQGPADADMRFAAAVAGFGQILRDDAYLGDWGIDDAIALAASSSGDDPFGYRREAVSLMRLAGSLMR